jgi:hypothetical protein
MLGICKNNSYQNKEYRTLVVVLNQVLPNLINLLNLSNHPTKIQQG